MTLDLDALFSSEPVTTGVTGWHRPPVTPLTTRKAKMGTGFSDVSPVSPMSPAKIEGCLSNAQANAQRGCVGGAANEFRAALKQQAAQADPECEREAQPLPQELDRLIRRVAAHHGFTEAELQEALDIAALDVDGALVSFRALAAEIEGVEIAEMAQRIASGDSANLGRQPGESGVAKDRTRSSCTSS